MLFQGCGTAMVTPFRKDGSLDEQTLRSQIAEILKGDGQPNVEVIDLRRVS